MAMIEMLHKLIKRTERDVAFAGAMVGSVAAMQKLFPTIEHYSTLKVNFYGGAWRQWNCLGDSRPIDPWRDFLRWYHGRLKSTCYVMTHGTGADMFQRCDIRDYEIRYGEREKGST